MATKDNLREAFSGESQANRRYLAFAEKADKEGKEGIAKLFRAAAEAETVHALNHLETLGIGSTEENIQRAIEGETKEFGEMYPKFIEKAEEEGNKDAEKTFNYAKQVEEIHAKLYKKAKEILEKGKDLEEEYYVCQTCGNTVSDLPEICPICGMPKSQFKKI